MSCAKCSALVLVPLVKSGTTARKIAEKARQACQNIELTPREKANIYSCADTLEWCAAELHRLKEEAT